MVEPSDLMITVSDRRLGVTLHLQDGIIVYLDMPKPDGAELLDQAGLERLARARGAQLLQNAAERLAEERTSGKQVLGAADPVSVQPAAVSYPAHGDHL